MAMKMMKAVSLENELDRPILCPECEGVMVYRGLGEYRCEECGGISYDNYGKVRNYLEKHGGANVGEISDETGVSHKAIREMIKENRFEVIESRAGYIVCEMCGVDIKSGRLCHKCEELYHKQVEEQTRAERKKGKGYADGQTGEEGSKRYTRQR